MQKGQNGAVTLPTSPRLSCGVVVLAVRCDMEKSERCQLAPTSECG